MNFDTRIAQAGLDRSEARGAVSFPLYLSATFRRPAVGEGSGYDYSRTGNPTRNALEKAMADLESGVDACAFSSGMAAIATVFLLFDHGDHVIVTEDLYGGTYGLLRQIFARHGVQSTFVDTSDTARVEAAVRPNTVAVFVEIPTNPLLKVADIPGLAALAERRGLLLIVDNTLLTPYLHRPLEWGAHIVIHSATKYIGGHNDLLAGVTVCRDADIAEKLRELHGTVGATLSPYDSWLLLRGMKTLALRMERQQQNAQTIARWLVKHPSVGRVYYAGLPDHPGYERLKAQSRGAGGMIAFTVSSADAARQVLQNVRVFSFAESLGGVESLITYPKLQTHARIPEQILTQLGIDDTLLRLSVGIEQVNDLIEDLRQALANVEAETA